MEFAGRLASFSPSNLLQWAENERQTGVLVVRNSRREKRFSFRAGRVVGCRSNLVQETFGRHLVDRGLVPAGALARVIAHTRTTGTPTGRALVDLGILQSDAVLRELETWISESLQDLCLWRRGVFVFHESEPPELPMEVAVGSMGVVLEGARWSDELARMRKTLPDGGVLLRRSPEWRKATLSLYEQRIAREFELESSLSSARTRTGGLEFPFLAAVHAMVERGVLIVSGHDSVTDGDSREIDLRDFLSADAEKGSTSHEAGRDVTMPVDVVERLVPVWLRPPPPQEIARLAPRLRLFVEGIDGSAPLGRLFARDPEQREDETDLLLLGLERGAIALFPQPLAEYWDASAVGQALERAGLPARSRHPA